MAVVEGSVDVRRHDDGRVEVLQAPPVARIALAVLADRDPVVLRVTGREISFAGQVRYRVVGWDDVQAALVLERVEGSG